MTQSTVNYLMGGGLAALTVGGFYLFNLIKEVKQVDANKGAVKSFLDGLTAAQTSLLMSSITHGHNFAGDFIAALNDAQKYQYSGLLSVIGSGTLKPYYSEIVESHREKVRG
ncbi:gp108 [Erwinia phage vB_Eam-MM7]|uniref:Gp108 n=1 Tax=Erwinia phage vB_Eam-MM7 TaxID=1051674 RepID=G0YPU0_9CAUD|nr:gp108 [Erwinia phage vB_Eam-MM7]AEJ81367.1 gp108 [Erwinia phage vB_Eam-MM7]